MKTNPKLLETIATCQQALNLTEQIERSPFDLPDEIADDSWVSDVLQSVLQDESLPPDMKLEVDSLRAENPSPEETLERLVNLSKRMLRTGSLHHIGSTNGTQDLRPCILSITYKPTSEADPRDDPVRGLFQNSVLQSQFPHRRYLNRMKESLESPDSLTCFHPLLEPQMALPLRPGSGGGISVDIQDAGLTDKDAMELLRGDERLESLNAKGNRLTDSFAKHAIQRIGKDISEIDLSDNQAMTSEVVAWITNVFNVPQSCLKLKSLCLAGIKMSGTQLTDLANNLNASTTPVLEKLDLSRTDLGKNDDIGCEALAFAILQLRRLKVLWLSGNFLREYHLNKLGDALTEMDILEELNLSDNSPSYDTSGSLALDSFCSMMGSIASLKTLVLRNNSLSDKSAFILADSLCIHPNIIELDLADNPAIGAFGTLALVKLIVFNNFPTCKKIQKICLENSFTPSKSALTEFNFSDPSGHYALDLACPFNRAVVRQCLRHWELVQKRPNEQDEWFRQTFDETFYDLRYNGEKFVPERDIEDVWLIPTDGRLTFTAIYRFSSPEQISDPRKFFARPADHIIQPISDLKEVDDNMFSCFFIGMYGLTTSILQRSMLIDCISTFFKFTAEQVDRLVKDRSNTKTLRVRIAGNLLPKKTTGVLRVLADHTGSLECYFRRKSQVHHGHDCPSDWFTGENPTGDYQLDLSDPKERRIAHWIVLIDRYDIEKLKLGMAATNIPSFTNIRNCRLNGVPFEYNPDWVIPCDGIWKLDYLSPHRFPVEFKDRTLPKPIPDPLWGALVDAISHMIQSDTTKDVIVIALRSLTRCRFFIDCNQLATLLKIFDAKYRTDLVATFLRRLVDYPELKEVLCRPRMGLEPLIDTSMLPELEKRIGQLALMNPIKVDNSTFTCDLKTTEGRLIAGMVLKLLSKEKGSRVVNSRIGSDLGTAVAADPPKSWNTNLPRDGFWSMTYVSSEDGSGADKSLRKQMAINVCGFDSRTFSTV